MVRHRRNSDQPTEKDGKAWMNGLFRCHVSRSCSDNSMHGLADVWFFEVSTYIRMAPGWWLDHHRDSVTSNTEENDNTHETTQWEASAAATTASTLTA